MPEELKEHKTVRLEIDLPEALNRDLENLDCLYGDTVEERALYAIRRFCIDRYEK